MPLTRSQRKKEGMGSLQEEASGQSSPRPFRKGTPASLSDVEQENTTTSTDTPCEKPSMDTSQSKASAGYQVQASPVLKRRFPESSSTSADHEDQKGKKEGTNLATSSKERLPVEEGSSKHKEIISQDPKTRKESRRSRQQKKSNNYVWIFLVMGGVLSIFVVAVHMSKPRGKVPSLDEKQREFERNMKEVKQDFQMQEQNLWDVVEATVINHLGRGSIPTQPIVLLLGSHPESSDTTLCLIKRLEKILSTALNERVPDVTLIDGRDYQKMNADKAKMELDECLQASFDSGQKVAVILNLDDLPPCSILLFHSYCDNDNARYMDVALIFTVTLDKDQVQKQATPSKPLSFKSKVAFQISDHLTKTWVNKCPKLTEEKVEAMLSRIANNVGIVNHEKSPSC